MIYFFFLISNLECCELLGEKINKNNLLNISSFSIFFNDYMKFYNSFFVIRQDPEWPISSSAKNAEASDRTLYLSSPKPLHRNYTPFRQLPTPVPESARNATASPRICSMSRPKTKLPDTIDYGPFEQPLWCVSPSARAAVPTDRVTTLSSPKPFPQIIDRDPQWEVSDAAKRGYATSRVQNLAKHKRRIDANESYDFYIVSSAARTHRASTRLAELASPNPRKTRQKYQFAKAT